MHGPVAHHDALAALIVPAHGPTIAAAQKALARTDVSTSIMADILRRDPVIVLEICRSAYSTGLARGDNSNGPSLGEMIGRLGLKHISQLIADLATRDAGLSAESLDLLELHRSECVHLAEIAKKIAIIVEPAEAEACYTLGLFARYGDLLAVIHLRGTYIELVRDNRVRSKLIYKLTKEYEFDPEAMSLRYLRLHGMPEKILSCLDREAQAAGRDSLFRKVTVLSALELKTAGEEEKFAQYGPEKSLPARSNLRMLQISDAQHRRIYEEISAFLGVEVETSSDTPPAALPRTASAALILPTPQTIFIKPVELIDGLMPSSARIKRIEKLRKRAAEMAANRAATIATETQTAHPEHRRSNEILDPVVPVTPLIVQAIRGIRNAESVYGLNRLEIFREATFTICKSIVEASGRYAAPIFFAARAYYPAQFRTESQISIEQATKALTPREVAAIIGISYLLHEIQPRCPENEWRTIYQKMAYEMAVGQLVGKVLVKIGPGYGMLLPALRYLTLGLFNIANPEAYKQYRVALISTGDSFDTAIERELFGVDHRIVMGRLAQELGFGVAIAKAIADDNPHQAPEIGIDILALADRWITSIHRLGSPFADEEVYERLMPSREEAIKLRDRVKEISHHLACPWLAKGRNDIKYDPQKQFNW